MSESHNAHSINIPCVAAGSIAIGHCVDLTSWTEAGGYVVTQSSGVNTAWGVYIGEQAAVISEHVEICIFGPCKAWLDGAITVGQRISNDADAHVVAETVDKKRAIGQSMATNGATENFGEVFVHMNDTSL